MIATQTSPVKTSRPLVLVAERDRDRWQAALDRYVERLSQRDDPLSPFRPVIIRDGVCRSYDVVSYSQPGVRHLVELFLMVDAGLYASCDCTAGELSHVCQHMAGAIDDAGWWPFAVARQLELAELPVSQAPPSLYRLGQAVRYARRRKSIFSVQAMQYTPERGWLYTLETLDGVLWSRPVAEFDLTPHTNKRRRAA